MLRNLKDAFIVTQKASGAEVIPFIKVWVMLPMAFLMTYIFTRLKNRLSTENVFYAMISIFLGYFLIFTFVLFPRQDALELNNLAESLKDILPAGCKGLIAMCRYWIFTSFYVMAELWSNIILSVLFWGFANEITKVTEAKRMYGILGFSANISGIASSQIALYFLNKHSASTQWSNHNLIPLILIVISLGFAIMILIKLMHVFVLFKDPHFIQSTRSSIKTKRKMSLRQSFKSLFKSKYIFSIAFIVVSYNMIINLLEVIWKDQVKALYPSASEFAAYMNHVTTWTGIIALLVAILVTGSSLQKLGWTKTALLTPMILLITSIGFFGFIAFEKYESLGIITTLLSVKPLAIIVFFGTAQNCLSRAAKYTVFDATKELSFIPLDKEERFHAKAAIDGVGSRVGKSTGSVIHQGLLIGFGTLIASASYVGFIVFIILSIWCYLTLSLGKQFNQLTQEQNKDSSPTTQKTEPLTESAV
jgi:ATP:ADP antiporter, AAA family